MSYEKSENLLSRLCYSLSTLKSPNSWSYVALSTACLHLETKESDKSVKKQEILEFLVKKTSVNKKRVENIFKEIERALKGCGYNARRVKIKAVSPAISGVSDSFGKTTFEVGLHLHPILNIPYIPSTTIKGAVRAGFYKLLLKSNTPDRNDAEEACRRVFGDKDFAGLVGFTDAYPVEVGEWGYLLIPDVMTPHYGSDVSNELEAKPNPIIYPVISPNTIFQFYLYFKMERRDKETIRILNVGRRKEASGRLVDLAEEPSDDVNSLGYLDLAVLYTFYQGVGAKTSINYSKFEVVEYSVVG